MPCSYTTLRSKYMDLASNARQKALLTSHLREGTEGEFIKKFANSLSPESA